MIWLRGRLCSSTSRFWLVNPRLLQLLLRLLFCDWLRLIQLQSQWSSKAKLETLWTSNHFGYHALENRFYGASLINLSLSPISESRLAINFFIASSLMGYCWLFKVPHDLSNCLICLKAALTISVLWSVGWVQATPYLYALSASSNI